MPDGIRKTYKYANVLQSCTPAPRHNSVPVMNVMFVIWVIRDTHKSSFVGVVLPCLLAEQPAITRLSCRRANKPSSKLKKGVHFLMMFAGPFFPILSNGPSMTRTATRGLACCLAGLAAHETNSRALVSLAFVPTARWGPRNLSSMEAQSRLRSNSEPPVQG